MVGAGVIGLATALAAADRGARVVVVEGERPGAGQSTGPGRIFRHITDTSERVGLAVRARRAWREAEERFGVPLLGRQGTLLVGEPAAHAARLAAAGVEHRVLDGPGVREALPLLGPWPEAGLLDPGGGSIDSEAFVRALAGALRDRIVRDRVLEVRADGDGAALAGEAGTVRAGRVLIAAGAGGPALARTIGLHLPVRVAVHHRVTFGPVRAGAPGDPPCLLERSGLLGPRCYGGPQPGGRYAIGVGAFDDRPRGAAVAATAAHVARAFPGVVPEAGAVVRCESTVLAGDPELFGLYAGDPPAAAAFAGGNLFKFAPLLGDLLADALLEGRVDPALRPPDAPPAAAG